MSQHIRCDLVGGSTGCVSPVVGINLVAHRYITHGLRKLEWMNLILGIRLRVD